MLFLRARLSSRQQTAQHEPITLAGILSGSGECKQRNNLLPKDDVITLAGAFKRWLFENKNSENCFEHKVCEWKAKILWVTFLACLWSRLGSDSEIFYETPVLWNSGSCILDGWVDAKLKFLNTHAAVSSYGRDTLLITHDQLFKCYNLACQQLKFLKFTQPTHIADIFNESACFSNDINPAAKFFL